MNVASKELQSWREDSTQNILLHSRLEDDQRSQQVERQIANIRAQIRKQDVDRNGSDTENSAANYQFGERLHFGLNGNGLPYMGAGWHLAEASFTWSEAHNAYLHFVVPSPNADLILDFAANGYTNSKISYQNLAIDINGIPCCQIPVSVIYTYSIIVPKSVIASKHDLNIQFRCGSRASPSQFKRRSDPRILGIALHSLVISISSISN